MNSNLVNTLLVSLCTISITGCNGSTPLKPTELAKALEKEGWTYTDIPRELLGPGSIVSITDSAGISYRGNLTDCIDDPDVTNIKIGTAGVPNFDKSYELKVGALFDYHNARIGPEVGKVKSVTFKAGELQEEALSSIRVEEWLEANIDSLSPTCERYLKGDDRRQREQLEGTIFVLTDVLKVTGYEYAFTGENSAKIKLSESTLRDYLTLSADVSYAVTESGDLRIESPVYIAFKESIFLPSDASQGATITTGEEASAILNRRLNLLD